MISLVQKCWAVLRVGLVVLWVRLLLQFKSLPQVLDRLSSGSVRGTPDDAVMRRLVYYVDRWLQLFPYNRKGNCFPRSLALYRIARRLGYPVVFYCGVRKDLSGFDGHAWLMLESQAFYERGMHWQGFTVTFFYPPDRTRTVSQGSAVRAQSLRTMEP